MEPPSSSRHLPLIWESVNPAEFSDSENAESPDLSEASSGGPSSPPTDKSDTGESDTEEAELQAKLATAKRHAELGEWDLLLGVCAETVQKHPNSFDLLVLHVSAYHSKGKWEEMIPICKKLIKLDPASTFAWKKLEHCRQKIEERADRSFAEERWAEALQDYGLLLTHFPAKGETYKKLILCYQGLQNWESIVLGYMKKCQVCPRFEYTELIAIQQACVKLINEKPLITLNYEIGFQVTTMLQGYNHG